MPLVKKNSFGIGEPSTLLLGYSSRSLIIIIAFAIVFLAAIGVAGYFFLQYQQTQEQLNKSTQANEQAALLNEVGKLIVLPTSEQPTIATVSDINRLKGQQFFVHARNGDKVLIYPKAQEAILYDPIANKIVEVGPIALTQMSPTPASGSEMIPLTAPVKIAIYNGTLTVGLAGKVAVELEQKLPNVTIVAKSDAQKSDYSTTIIVDQTGKAASQAAALAQILHGKVDKLPVGELSQPKADVIVILGK